MSGKKLGLYSLISGPISGNAECPAENATIFFNIVRKPLSTRKALLNTCILILKKKLLGRKFKMLKMFIFYKIEFKKLGYLEPSLQSIVIMQNKLPYPLNP